VKFHQGFQPGEGSRGERRRALKVEPWHLESPFHTMYPAFLQWKYSPFGTAFLFWKGRKAWAFAPDQDMSGFFPLGLPYPSPSAHTAEELSHPVPMASATLPVHPRVLGCPPSRDLCSGSSSRSSAPDISVLFKYLQQTVVKKIEA